MAAAEAAVRMIPTACGDSDLANEGASRLVTVGQAAIGNQVLPDGRGIPATNESLLDQLGVAGFG